MACTTTMRRYYTVKLLTSRNLTSMRGANKLSRQLHQRAKRRGNLAHGSGLALTGLSE